MDEYLVSYIAEANKTETDYETKSSISETHHYVKQKYFSVRK